MNKYMHVYLIAQVQFKSTSNEDSQGDMNQGRMQFKRTKACL